jgi:hypothetical protein
LDFTTDQGGRMELDYQKTYPALVTGYSLDGEMLSVSGACFRCYGEPIAIVVGTQALYLNQIHDTNMTARFHPRLLRNEYGNLNYGILWATGQLVLATGRYHNPGPPIIDRIDPPIGSTGTTITLYGKHLLPADASDPEVTINSIGLTIVNFNDTTIEARLDAVATKVAAPAYVSHSGMTGSSTQPFHWVAYPTTVLNAVGVQEVYDR